MALRHTLTAARFLLLQRRGHRYGLRGHAPAQEEGKNICTYTLLFRYALKIPASVQKAVAKTTFNLSSKKYEQRPL